MNCRLVVEWNGDLNNFFATAPPTSIGILEPQLVYDEVVGAKTKDQTIPYYSLEDDRAVISAVGAGLTEVTRFKIDGFNKKNVRRMLMINNLRGSLNDKVGIDRSVPQLDEKISVTMNGKKQLPFNGITSENKQQMVNDIWGSQCYSFGSNFVGMTGAASLYDTNAQIAAYSYGALDIKQTVDEMQFEYTRTGGSTAELQDAFDFLVFAEVSKVLSIKGGKVVLA